MSSNNIPSQQLTNGVSALPDLKQVLLPQQIASRKAKVQDVTGMSALINEFASKGIMLARGPLYLYQNVQDYRVITLMHEGKECVIACGGIHILWEELSEIRSVAVHPDIHRSGIGKIIVQDLINDARNLGAKQILNFTLAPDFFSKFGFLPISRDVLPPVVWTECSKCSKFYKCDEVILMKAL